MEKSYQECYEHSHKNSDAIKNSAMCWFFRYWCHLCTYPYLFLFRYIFLRIFYISTNPIFKCIINNVRLFLWKENKQTECKNNSAIVDNLSITSYHFCFAFCSIIIIMVTGGKCQYFCVIKLFAVLSLFRCSFINNY